MIDRSGKRGPVRRKDFLGRDSVSKLNSSLCSNDWLCKIARLNRVATVSRVFLPATRSTARSLNIRQSNASKASRALSRLSKCFTLKTRPPIRLDRRRNVWLDLESSECLSTLRSTPLLEEKNRIDHSSPSTLSFLSFLYLRTRIAIIDNWLDWSSSNPFVSFERRGEGRNNREPSRVKQREATGRSLIGQGKTGSARRGGEPDGPTRDNANRRFVTRYIERSTFLFIQKRGNYIYIYIYRMMIRFMIHSCDSHFDFEESENKRELYAGRYLKMYTYIELDSRVWNYFSSF